jgi:anti-sigma factor RsiW
MTLLDRLTMRSCRQVARVLQDYLDGEVDLGTARMVHDHLEECRRCGLEASTYRAIKTALPIAEATTGRVEVDPQAVARLRRFAEALSHPSDHGEE